MPEENDARPKQHKSGSDLTVVRRTKAKEKKPKPDNRNKKTRRDKEARPTNAMQIWLPIIINAMLLLVVGFQAYIYRRQWMVMQQQLEQAKQVQEVSDRAWVVLTTAILKNPIKVGECPVATLGFTNTGKTPANNTEFQGWIAITLAKTPSRNLERPPPSDSPSRAIVAPSGIITQHLSLRTNLTEKQVGVLTSGEAQLYIYGVVSYDDIFTHHWQTEFCAVLDMGLETAFNPTPDGNYIH